MKNLKQALLATINSPLKGPLKLLKIFLVLTIPLLSFSSVASSNKTDLLNNISEVRKTHLNKIRKRFEANALDNNFVPLFSYLGVDLSQEFLNLSKKDRANPTPEQKAIMKQAEITLTNSPVYEFINCSGCDINEIINEIAQTSDYTELKYLIAEDILTVSNGGKGRLKGVDISVAQKLLEQSASEGSYLATLHLAEKVFSKGLSLSEIRTYLVNLPQSIRDDLYQKYTSSKLYDSYTENELAYEEKVEGKLIEVSGMVNKVERDIFGVPYLALRGQRFEYHVPLMLYFDDEYKSQFLALKKREQVSALCLLGENPVITPVLKHCEVFIHTGAKG